MTDTMYLDASTIEWWHLNMADDAGTAPIVNPIDVCEWVDYMDDMYPEFAPDPIEVRCDGPVVAIVVLSDRDPDDPESGCEQRVCAVHARAALEEMLDANSTGEVLGVKGTVDRI